MKLECVMVGNEIGFRVKKETILIQDPHDDTSLKQVEMEWMLMKRMIAEEDLIEVQ